MKGVNYFKRLVLVPVFIQWLGYNFISCDCELIKDLDLKQTNSRNKNYIISTNTPDHKVKSWKSVPWSYSNMKLRVLQTQERTNVHKLMIKYENLLTERLKHVQRYLKDYEESVPCQEIQKGRPEEIAMEIEICRLSVASNPLLAYRMIRRFAVEISLIESSMSYEKTLLEDLKSSRENFEWPTHNDLRNAMAAVLNIQLACDKNPKEMTQGIYEGGKSISTSLSRVHMVEIGENAVTMGELAAGIEWLETGLQKRYESITDKLSNKTHLKNVIQSLKETHDEEFDSTDTTDLTLFSSEVSGLELKELPPRRRSLFTGFNRDSLDGVNLVHRYNLLCRDITKPIEMTISYLKRLRCWLDQYSHPYFVLRPLKTEMLNYDPYLVIFHEVVNIQEADALINVASYRSIFQDKTMHGKTTLPLARIDEEKKAFKRFEYLEKRMEIFTSLNIQGRRNSEPLEVSEHNFAARYFLEGGKNPTLKNKSDQLHSEIMANFLIVLRKSETGGNLVFPILGIHISVETSLNTGSAIFWYTTYKNGSPDPRTMHAHCPVIYGSKWTALKKIKGRNNAFTRPCSRLNE